jgi:hypothetical protein
VNSFWFINWSNHLLYSIFSTFLKYITIICLAVREIKNNLSNDPPNANIFISIMTLLSYQITSNTAFFTPLINSHCIWSRKAFFRTNWRKKIMAGTRTQHPQQLYYYWSKTLNKNCKGKLDKFLCQSHGIPSLHKLPSTEPTRNCLGIMR